MKSCILMVVILQITVASILAIPQASCQVYYVNLYPTKGTVLTNIVVKAVVPPTSNSWVFWDDVVIAQNIPYDSQILGFALNFTCPNEKPYSDLGNHTVTIESNYEENGSKIAYFNATFEIIEYLPTSEFLALNSTYYSLLANYSDLLTTYDSLLTNYTLLIDIHNNLSFNYATLLSNYNSLAANYNSLVANYNALTSNYNSLSTDYESLRSLYSLFLANYSSLLGSYESLNSNYHALKTDYDSLNTTYGHLETTYSALTSELTATRMLGYVFIASTIVLAAMLVFFVSRKPKQGSRAR